MRLSRIGSGNSSHSVCTRNQTRCGPGEILVPSDAAAVSLHVSVVVRT